MTISDRAGAAVTHVCTLMGSGLREPESLWNHDKKRQMRRNCKIQLQSGDFARGQTSQPTGFVCRGQRDVMMTEVFFSGMTGGWRDH